MVATAERGDLAGSTGIFTARLRAPARAQPCLDAALGSQSFLPARLASQKTKPISRKKISTVTETTWVAKPSVGVKASTEVSRITP